MSRTTAICGVAGLVAGTVVAVAVVGSAHGGGADSFIAAAHLPPLLTLPGENVTLRYELICGPPKGDLEGACDGGGDVYARAGHAGAFRKLPLIRGADSAEGRYFVRLPPDIASSPSGFSYYAVLRDDAHGTTTTLPAAGADAPQNSYRLANPVDMDLGVHRFGATRDADDHVVDARWGSRLGEVGLGGGVGDAHFGPSAFDVARDGTVSLLDEVNGRVERFRDGSVAETRVDIPPVPDDMSIGDDGTIYVADGRSDSGETPLLRTFAADGRLRGTEHLAERTWSQLRVGPSGPVVQQQPSEQWMPPARARDGFAGRPLGDGSRLIVLRVGAGELRVARVTSARVRDAWRFVSNTPLGEVQLVERSGSRLVVIAKTYTETQDEFEVVVVDADGTSNRFSVPSAEWAETAPLARFRFDGRSVFQLGSTSDGVFVDRFDLGREP